MKIVYLVYGDWNQEQCAVLNSYGFNVEVGYSRVDIEESSKNIELLKMIDEWGLKKYVDTMYAKEDFLHSSLFVYVGAWKNGYPMPDNDNGYLELSYDTTNYCKHCGIGKIQKSPFRLKKEPNWRNKGMFELNWIHDEVFVRRDIYDNLFKEAGIGCKEVLLYKKEKFIEDTLQLDIPIIEVPLQLEEQPYEVCKECSRKKFSPQIRGLFPGYQKELDKPIIFKSNESFGSGGEAHRIIFISRHLHERIKSLKIRLNVWPVRRY